MSMEIDILKERMQRASTLVYIQLILGTIRMIFCAFLGTEGDSVMPAYDIPTFVFDSVLVIFAFIAAAKIRQASRGWAYYIIVFYSLSLIVTTFTSSIGVLVVKLILAYFVFRGIVAVFEYHKISENPESLAKTKSGHIIWKIIGLTTGGCLGIFVLLVAWILYADSDTLIAGSDFPVEYSVQLRDQGLLEGDEQIEQFYGGDLMGLDGDYCYVTRQKIVLNYIELGERPIAINYVEIFDLYFEQDEDQSYTYAIIELYNGTSYGFGIPSADSSDQIFLSAMYEYYDDAVVQATATSSAM